MNESDRRVLDAVVAQGYLTREQVEALVGVNKGGKPLGELLIEGGVISRDTMELMAGTARATTPSAKSAPADPPEVAAAKASPKRIGKYLLVGELGRGGMGVVYKAWQDDLRRYVAVKVLTSTEDPTAVERFHREAQMASKVRHPGIVAVHEFGEHEGKPYLVMDLIAGQPLDAIMKRRLPTRTAVEIVAAAAEALGAAHAQQIIHRDVKPSNMLVEIGKGEVHVALTDFGLAKSVNVKEKLTAAGTILGTPHYMSPEQAKGHQRLDARSDVYSLGAVLYELVTGKQVVVAGQIFEMLNKIISEDPVPPRRHDPKLPQDLETVVLKCLEKSPGRRYANAAELADDLNAFLEHRAVAAVPVGGATKAVRWIKGKPWMMAAAAAVLAAALGLGLFVVMRSGKAEADQLRGELSDLQKRFEAAKTDEERAALERELREKRAKLEKTTPEPPPPPAVDARPAKAFDDLRRAVTASPSAFRVHLAAAEKFLAEFPTAPEADGVRRLKAELEALRASETAKAVLAMESEVRSLCAQKKFGRALKAILLPADLEAPLEALKGEVGRLSAAAWEELVERARQSADPASVLSEAFAFELPELEAKARDLIASIKAPADVPPPPDLAEQVASALAADDLAKARALAAPDAALAKALAALGELESRALVGFAARSGETAPLLMANGTTVKVQFGGVKNGAVLATVVEFRAETQYRLKEIAASEVIAAAKRGGLDSVALAFAQILWGDRAAGKADLEAAGFGAIAEAVLAERLEKGALAALESLRKGSQKSLAALDGEFAETKAVKAAFAEIEQYRYAAELKGVDLAALLHAAVEKPTGPAAMRLEYGFTEAELADLLVEQGMMGDRETEGIEFRRVSDGLRIVNARVAIGPPMRGETTFEVRLVTENGATGSVVLGLPPLQIVWQPQAGGVWVTDARKNGANVLGTGSPGVKVGQEAVLRVTIRGGTIAVSVPGAEREGTVQPIAEPLQLRVTTWPNLKVLLKRVAIEGVVDPGWAKKAAPVREPKSGPAVVLFNTRSMQGWRGDAVDRFWKAESGLLRIDANEQDVPVIATERKFRNGRLTFEYRCDRGRSLKVSGRFSWDATCDFQLPTTEVGVWRKVEFVMLEDRGWAFVDGVPVKADPRTGTVVAGGIGLSGGRYASAVFRDLKFTPFEGPATPRGWIDLLTGDLEQWKVASGNGGWTVEKGVLTAKPPFSMRSVLPFDSADVTFKIKIEHGGEAVVSVRYNGERLGTDVTPPADGKWHEVVVTMREDVKATIDGKPAAVRHRSGDRAANDGNLWVEARAGKVELKEFKARAQ